MKTQHARFAKSIAILVCSLVMHTSVVTSVSAQRGPTDQGSQTMRAPVARKEAGRTEASQRGAVRKEASQKGSSREAAVRKNGSRESGRIGPSRRPQSKRYQPVARVVFPRISWPSVHVRIDWPWKAHYSRHRTPRYRHRRVVVTGRYWGHGSLNSAVTSRVEIDAHYSRRVLFADDHSAEFEIRIEKIDTYVEGRYYGSIAVIPEEFRTIRARVQDNGRVEFDREIFILGDPGSGFEMVSTQFYGGYVMDNYRASDGYAAAKLDFRNGRASRIRKSRLFRPFDARAHVPVSLLPEEQGWLWDDDPELWRVE
jgi:hypothetical protein